MDQLDWPFHLPQLFTNDVDLEVGHLSALDLGLYGSPLALPYPHHQDELSNTALSRPLNATISRCQTESALLLSSFQRQPTCTHTSRASYTVLPSQDTGPRGTGTQLLYYYSLGAELTHGFTIRVSSTSPGKVQDLLSAAVSKGQGQLT